MLFREVMPEQTLKCLSFYSYAVYCNIMFPKKCSFARKKIDKTTQMVNISIINVKVMVKKTKTMI